MRRRNPQHESLPALREKVRELIAIRGYSAVERFAHEHGIEQSVLSRFLSGNRDLMLSTLLRITDALGVDPRFLFEPETPASAVKDSSEGTYRSARTSPRQRPNAKVVLSEVSSLTVLRTPDDTDPLVLRAKSRDARK